MSNIISTRTEILRGYDTEKFQSMGACWIIRVTGVMMGLRGAGPGQAEEEGSLVPGVGRLL